VRSLLKALESRLRILFFRRNGCLFDRNVVVHNSGEIRGEAGSSIGGLKNQTTRLFGNPSTFIHNKGTILLREIARIHKGAKISNSGSICMGARSYINPNALIVISKSLEIGSDCAISWNVSIMDDDLHKILPEKPESDRGIIIGDHVWIGSDVKILKNVKIGSGSVIAANSLVNSDIPENCLAAGIPARVIKTNVNWS